MRRLRRMSIALAVAAAASSAPIASAPAGASLGVRCGSLVEVPALPDVRLGASEHSRTVRFFAERPSVRLAVPLPVDIVSFGRYSAQEDLASPRPSVPAGTDVSSFLLHSDPVGKPPRDTIHTLTLGFTTDVLGISIADESLDESDTVVGNAATAYPSDLLHRGLELSPVSDIVRFVDRRTVRLQIVTSTVLDQVRVITAAPPPGEPASGYQLVAADGGLFSFGNRSFLGSMGGQPLNAPVVGGAQACTGTGYWMVARDGGIFAFQAPFLGSMGRSRLNQPMVAMAPTPQGTGYWLVASDGGIFAFGAAPFRGSTGAIRLNRPVVGMASTPSGDGYWLVASDGGIFAFGDALFFGSTGAIALNSPVVAMAATPSGEGYWLATSDGGVFAFGDAAFLGSMASVPLNQPVVAIVATPSANGYWLVARDGGIFAFGDARFLGSMGGTPLVRPVVGAF